MCLFALIRQTCTCEQRLLGARSGSRKDRSGGARLATKVPVLKGHLGTGQVDSGGETKAKLNVCPKTKSKY